MKLLLTSVGLKGHPEIKKAFIESLGKKPSQAKVLVVSTAIEGDAHWRYVQKTIRSLKNVGIVNIRVFSLDRKIQKSELRGIDVIYVCGGNTFWYLDRIRRTGLGKEIVRLVKRGVVYFGVSAGSIVAGLNIESAGWKHADRNTIHLKDLHGLNLAPFVISVHLDESNIGMVKKAADKARYPVMGITDQQAIFVKDGFATLIGKTSKLSFIKLAKR
jgi:dipeptidase E